ncbi:hypothetical protein EFD56_01390 [Rhizobium phaseoli]|nr:hypothetical protein EFD56_01390 [Rhizobium phaseoli]
MSAGFRYPPRRRLSRTLPPTISLKMTARCVERRGPVRAWLRVRSSRLSRRRKNCVFLEYELCTQGTQSLTPAERRVIFPAVEQRMAGDRRWRRHPRAISTKI